MDILALFQIILELISILIDIHQMICDNQKD